MQVKSSEDIELFAKQLYDYINSKIDITVSHSYIPPPSPRYMEKQVKIDVKEEKKVTIVEETTTDSKNRKLIVNDIKIYMTDINDNTTSSLKYDLKKYKKILSTYTIDQLVELRNNLYNEIINIGRTIKPPTSLIQEKVKKDDVAKTKSIKGKTLLVLTEKDKPIISEGTILPDIINRKVKFDWSDFINIGHFKTLTDFILRAQRVIVYNEAECTYHIKQYEAHEDNIVFNIKYINTITDSVSIGKTENDTFITNYGKLLAPNKRCFTFKKFEYLPYSSKADLLNNMYKHKIWTTFTGYTYDYIPNFSNEALAKFMLDHVKIILSNGIEKTYQYVLNWLASIIQLPRTKFRKLMIFIGKGNIGKTGFFIFLAKILGQFTVRIIDKHDQIFGKFNNSISQGILLVLNEVGMNKNEIHENFETLKSYVTEDVHDIQKKGKEVSMNVKVPANFAVTCNARHNVAKQDHRTIIIECGDVSGDKKKYLETLRDMINNKKVQQAFFNLMICRDISNFDKDDSPTCELQEDNYLEGITEGCHRYLVESIMGINDHLNYFNNGVNINQPFQISSKELLFHYNKIKTKYSTEYTPITFGIRIKPFLLGNEKSGTMLYTMTIQDMADKLCKKYGINLDLSRFTNNQSKSNTPTSIEECINQALTNAGPSIIPPMPINQPISINTIDNIIAETQAFQKEQIDPILSPEQQKKEEDDLLKMAMLAD
jgi:hypothetical protein